MLFSILQQIERKGNVASQLGGSGGLSKSKIDRIKSQFRDFESPDPKDKFMRLANYMTKSAVWNSLSPYAVTVYVRMKAKYTSNNAENISLTYKEIKGLMDERTFRKARDELIAKGFIKFIERNQHRIRCNIYGFCADWWKHGK